MYLRWKYLLCILYLYIYIWYIFKVQNWMEDTPEINKRLLPINTCFPFIKLCNRRFGGSILLLQGFKIIFYFDDTNYYLWGSLLIRLTSIHHREGCSPGRSFCIPLWTSHRHINYKSTGECACVTTWLRLTKPSFLWNHLANFPPSQLY